MLSLASPSPAVLSVSVYEDNSSGIRPNTHPERQRYRDLGTKGLGQVVILLKPQSSLSKKGIISIALGSQEDYIKESK